ncbi:Aste57867_21346 [Aphanomyces stellatus]|uniref:Aste57867_21346 protein n=1 Tax=Aphanomyces stellatus TaxID=120398 RepID=A0A485LHB7_9STRA|nr:hypothetical protein As57867_021277 [Aphanomyces stellatus]VFT98018.1 Aste57867_21346 [Aphanomyces stellatus]
MIRKLALAAAAAVAVVSAGSPLAEANASLVNATTTSSSKTTPYGLVVFSKLLQDLKIVHDDSNPLSTLEYNEAVDGVEDLIRGRWNFDEKFKATVTKQVMNLIARMQPQEAQQLFDDVTSELLTNALTRPLESVVVNSSKVTNASKSNVITASEATVRSPLQSTSPSFVFGVFLACIAGIVAVFSVLAKEARKANKAPGISITAEVILAEIEDAEKMCSPPAVGDVVTV